MFTSDADPVGMIVNTCTCGRSFSRDSALTNHRRTCKKAKTRLSSALIGAKEARSRKRFCVDSHGASIPIEANHESVPSISATETTGSAVRVVITSGLGVSGDMGLRQVRFSSLPT